VETQNICVLADKETKLHFCKHLLPLVTIDGKVMSACQFGLYCGHQGKGM
jgi:hypothetical protein